LPERSRNAAGVQPECSQLVPAGSGLNCGMRLAFVIPACVALLLAAKPAVAAAPCDELVARLPNVNRGLCESARLQPSNVKSVSGRTLWVRDIKADNANLRVLVVGAIHGDELSSASVALHWLRLADQGVFVTPQAVHWRFIPALNPDGLLMVPPRRVNANGVDLNRNFPTPNWERDAKVYWEQRTNKDPRRYPGTKPLSEPESKFLHEEMQRFKPQLIVSIHAPYGVLDFDGPKKDGFVPPSKLGRLYLDQVGIFPGSLGNYGGVHKGVPVVTVELPNSTRTPLDAEMRQMWLDLLRWMSERVGERAAPELGVPLRTP
jgi:murein peptide amidase A